MTDIRSRLRHIDRVAATRKEENRDRAELRRRIEGGLARVHHPNREAIVRAMDAGQEPDDVLRLIMQGPRSGAVLRTDDQKK